MTGLVKRFSRRRNMSSSRIHCCHNGTEFKGKHILEQDELFCCVIISSGLKEKSICLFLLLESPRPLCPPQGPQTYQPTWELTLSFPSFLLGELCCQRKGAPFSFHNSFLLLRGIIPKLLRQHILLTLMLRVSDPGA